MRGSRLLASGLALFITGALAFACGSDDGPGAVPSASADGGDTDPAAVMPNDPTEAGGAEAEVEAGPPPVPSEFGLDARPANATCLAPPRPPSDVAVKFTPVFASLTLTAPMLMRQAPGDATRTYIALRAGTLVRFTTATPAIPATVLTVPNVNDDGEGGLLGFAFHPKFAQNGQVYLSYTATAAGVSGSQMRSVIARMTSTDGGATFAGYSELLTFDQTTATNHKGGSIEFGPDGFLYFGFGDGG